MANWKQFSVMLILLTIIDIISTRYVLLNNIGYEANPLMSYVTGSLILFSIMKMLGVLIIIGLFRHIDMKSKKASSVTQCLITFLMLIVVVNNLIVIASAIDNTFSLPTCINPSYDGSGDVFLITENNASSEGTIVSTGITGGYFDSGAQRLYNGDDILCSISDGTTLGAVGTQKRVFGTTEAGKVFYFDNPLVNFSAGYYSPPGSTNPIFMIDTLASTTTGRQLAIDSLGNVYTHTDTTILKYVKALDYSPQLIYTITSGIDYTQGTGVGCSYITSILDLSIDRTDKIHMLIGSGCSSINPPGNIVAYLSTSVIDTNGNIQRAYIQRDSQSAARVSGSPTITKYSTGSILLDNSEQVYNATIAAYAYKDTGSVSINITLFHYNNTIRSTISSLAGITDLSDIGYNNFQIYLSSPSQNLIRSYATNFEGYTQTSVVSGDAAYTYDTVFINSVYDTYFNNSKFQITYGLAYQATVAQQLIYSFRIDLLNPSGAAVGTYTPVGSCESPDALDFLFPRSYNCAAYQGSAISFSSPAPWVNGTYSVKMYEHNGSTGADALLASDSFIVLNQTGNLSTASTIIDVKSGANAIAVNQIDQFVDLLGFGVNSVSKLLFSVIIITVIGIIAIKISGGTVAMVVMFAPYVFFTFIDYIPKWIFIVVLILLAIASRVFR